MDILPQHFIYTRKSASQTKGCLLGISFGEMYPGKSHIKIKRKVRKKEKASNEINSSGKKKFEK